MGFCKTFLLHSETSASFLDLDQITVYRTVFGGGRGKFVLRFVDILDRLTSSRLYAPMKGFLSSSHFFKLIFFFSYFFGSIGTRQTKLKHYITKLRQGHLGERPQGSNNSWTSDITRTIFKCISPNLNSTDQFFFLTFTNIRPSKKNSNQVWNSFSMNERIKFAS